MHICNFITNIGLKKMLKNFMFLASILFQAGHLEATVGFSLANGIKYSLKNSLILRQSIHTKAPIGVIGAGRIGQMHIKNMKQHIPEAKIQWIADPHLSSSLLNDESIANKTLNYKDLLNDQEVSNVAIFASTDQHVPLIRECIRAGKKYILCEKPVSSDPQEIMDLEEEAEANKAQVMVAFNRRFDKDVQKIKEQILQGKIGSPSILKISNHDGIYPPMDILRNLGSIFSDLHSHDFDSARNVLGSEVHSVTAFGVAVHPEMKDIEGSYDTCALILRMKNDSLVMISGMRQDGGGYQNAMEAIGTDDRISFGPRLTIDPDSGEERSPKDFGEYFEQSMIDELREFVRCISEEEVVPVSLKEARYVAEISAAANKSAEIFLKTGRTQEVLISELRAKSYDQL